MLVAVTGIGYLPLVSVPMSSSYQLQSPKSAVTNVQSIEQISAPKIQTIKKEKPPEHKTYPKIGNASPESVTTAVEFYQSKGLTNVGVAYLVGNFIGESSLRPEAVGDNGLALGIAQWHPSRRVGLPGDLQGQLEYAWAEIQNYPLKDALYGSNEWVIQNGIKRYEGYGMEGERFDYARQLLKELQ